VARSGGREHDGVVRPEAGLRKARGEHRDEPVVGPERPRDDDVRGPLRLRREVDVHVVAGREQQGHDDRGAPGSQGTEHGRHIRLLHVDETRMHLDRTARGHGVHESGDGRCPARRGGAVRDREQRRSGARGECRGTHAATSISTIPPTTRVRYTASASAGSSRHAPVCRSYTCLSSGEAIVARSPREPTMPRAMTYEDVTGSRWSTAYSSPGEASTRAIWCPSTSTASPQLGSRASTSHTGNQPT